MFSPSDKKAEGKTKYEKRKMNARSGTSLPSSNAAGTSGGAGDGDSGGEEKRPNRNNLPQDKHAENEEVEDEDRMLPFCIEDNFVESLPEYPKLGKAYHFFATDMIKIQEDLQETYVENENFRKYSVKKRKDDRLLGKRVARQFECIQDSCPAKYLLGPPLKYFYHKNTSKIRSIVFINFHLHPILGDIIQVSNQEKRQSSILPDKIPDQPNYESSSSNEKEKIYRDLSSPNRTGNQMRDKSVPSQETSDDSNAKKSIDETNSSIDDHQSMPEKENCKFPQ